MASVSPKSLAHFLQQRSDHLSLLLSHIRLLRQITSVIRSVLPEPLSLHCHAANIDGDTIVIGCDSPAWAAKLRYLLPQLLPPLKEHHQVPTFRQIRIRVQPADQGETGAVVRQASMAEHSAALIASVAHDITDPDLKAALLRLSQRAKSVKNR